MAWPWVRGGSALEWTQARRSWGRGTATTRDRKVSRMSAAMGTPTSSAQAVGVAATPRSAGVGVGALPMQLQLQLQLQMPTTPHPHQQRLADLWRTLEACLSPDDAARGAAEEEVRRCEDEAPDWLARALTEVARPGEGRSGPTRAMALVVLKRFVERKWVVPKLVSRRQAKQTPQSQQQQQQQQRPTPPPALSPEDKATTRNAVLRDVFAEPDDVVAAQRAHLLAKLAEKDWLAWPELFPTLTAEATSANALHQLRAVTALLSVATELSLRRIGPDVDAFRHLAKMLLPGTCSLFARLRETSPAAAAAAPTSQPGHHRAADERESKTTHVLIKLVRVLVVAVGPPNENDPPEVAQLLRSYFEEVLSLLCSRDAIEACAPVGGGKRDHDDDDEDLDDEPPPRARFYLGLAKTIVETHAAHPVRFTPYLPAYTQWALALLLRPSLPRQARAVWVPPCLNFISNVLGTKSLRAASDLGAAATLDALFPPATLAELTRKAVADWMCLSPHDVREWNLDSEAATELDESLGEDESPRAAAVRFLSVMLDQPPARRDVTLTCVLSALAPPSAPKLSGTNLALAREAAYYASGLCAFRLHGWPMFPVFLRDELLPLLCSAPSREPFLVRRAAWLVGRWSSDVTPQTRDAVYGSLLVVMGPAGAPASTPVPAPAPAPAIVAAVADALHALVWDVDFTLEAFARFVPHVADACARTLVRPDTSPETKLCWLNLLQSLAGKARRAGASSAASAAATTSAAGVGFPPAHSWLGAVLPRAWSFASSRGPDHNLVKSGLIATASSFVQAVGFDAMDEASRQVLVDLVMVSVGARVPPSTQSSSSSGTPSTASTSTTGEAADAVFLVDAGFKLWSLCVRTCTASRAAAWFGLLPHLVTLAHSPDAVVGETEDVVALLEAYVALGRDEACFPLAVALGACFDSLLVTNSFAAFGFAETMVLLAPQTFAASGVFSRLVGAAVEAEMARKRREGGSAVRVLGAEPHAWAGGRRDARGGRVEWEDGPTLVASTPPRTSSPSVRRARPASPASATALSTSSSAGAAAEDDGEEDPRDVMERLAVVARGVLSLPDVVDPLAKLALVSAWSDAFEGLGYVPRLAPVRRKLFALAALRAAADAPAMTPADAEGARQAFVTAARMCGVVTGAARQASAPDLVSLASSAFSLSPSRRGAGSYYARAAAMAASVVAGPGPSSVATAAGVGVDGGGGGTDLPAHLDASTAARRAALHSDAALACDVERAYRFVSASLEQRFPPAMRAVVKSDADAAFVDALSRSAVGDGESSSVTVTPSVALRSLRFHQ